MHRRGVFKQSRLLSCLPFFLNWRDIADHPANPAHIGSTLERQTQSARAQYRQEYGASALSANCGEREHWPGEPTPSRPVEQLAASRAKKMKARRPRADRTLDQMTFLTRYTGQPIGRPCRRIRFRTPCVARIGNTRRLFPLFGEKSTNGCQVLFCVFIGLQSRHSAALPCLVHIEADT